MTWRMICILNWTYLYDKHKCTENWDNWFLFFLWKKKKIAWYQVTSWKIQGFFSYSERDWSRYWQLRCELYYGMFSKRDCDATRCRPTLIINRAKTFRNIHNSHITTIETANEIWGYLRPHPMWEWWTLIIFL